MYCRQQKKTGRQNVKRFETFVNICRNFFQQKKTGLTKFCQNVKRFETFVNIILT
jgi:hypothetical protein